jgi:hypothetical protein
MTTTKTDKVLDEQLARLGKAVKEREERRVIQLPLWPEPKRGTPNSFIRSALFAAIQGKDRDYLKERLLTAQQGITVKFTGQQLDQSDLDVWQTITHFSRETPLGTSSTFTAHSLLKALGLNTGNSAHKHLHSAIVRLTACAVEISHEGRTYGGPLLKSYRKEESTSYYNVELNRDLIKLFGESQWTALDWQQRQQLKRKPLAKALHAFYSSHRTPFALKVATLRDLTGSRNADLRDFKRKVGLALKELVRIGFLTDYTVEGDLVHVQRARVVGLPQQ